jgi:hypothetical protein
MLNKERNTEHEMHAFSEVGFRVVSVEGEASGRG